MTAEEMKEHAQRMVQHFPSNKVVNECECCSRHASELRVIFDWRGEYLTATTSFIGAIGILVSFISHHLFHFLLPSEHVGFSTNHSLCNSCFAEIKRRKFVAKLVKQFCLVLIVLAAMIFASTIVFVLLFAIPQPTKMAMVYILGGMGCGMACLWAGLRAEDYMVRWYIPKALRFISKPPFELVDFKIVPAQVQVPNPVLR
jgi:hypothetical protein